MSIEVIKPGSWSTIQGFGLFGMGSQGVAPGGVMDRLSARTANRVVANAPDAPVLEFTLLGPELAFLSAHRVCVLGGDFGVTINGAPCPTGKAIAVKKGDRLKVGRAAFGVRGYLAIRGGFKDTALPGAPPPALQSGDILPVSKAGASRKALLLRDSSPIQALMKNEGASPIRILPGPQAGYFSKAELKKLVTQGFRVSPQSNRMGVSLEGGPIRHERDFEIPSEANTFGAIQVPASGLPIVLGADLPITGGYPKIATVIERDHWRVAQARPGDELRFEWCTLQEARGLRAELARLERSC